MTTLPSELREVIEAGALARLRTNKGDGWPQVTVIWIGLDGEEIVSGHMSHHRKLRNIERDPRVVLSFLGQRDHAAVLSPYAVLRARDTVEPSDGAWDLLDGFTKLYRSAEDEFPAPKGPGYIVRYTVERISGVGPWVAKSAD